MPLKFAIPGQTIAKKNSQRVIRLGRRVSIRPSKAYDAWEEVALQDLQYHRIPMWRGSYPVEIMFFFFRKNKAKFDIDNMLCGTLDVLQKAGVIVDDSMFHVMPIIERRPDGYGWAIDKDNPRVEITIAAIK